MAGKRKAPDDVPAQSVKENRMVPVASLYPHAQNYKQHPPEQIRKITASLTRFGQVRSIVVQACENGSYTIVAGHGVVEAATQLKMLELRADVFASWVPETEIKGYLVADNLLGVDAVDDERVLAELLQEQSDAGFDLASMGSDDETLRQMLESLGDVYLGDGERDEAEDELPKEVETRAKLGDIWQCGVHRLLVGDCSNEVAMQSLLQGEKVQAVVSDPPYGMKLDTSFSYSKGNVEMSIKPTKGYAKVTGDDKDFDASLFLKMFPHLKEMFLFGADYYVNTLPNYGKDGSWMVWDKKNEALRNVLGLADFELIWSMQRHKRRVYAILWNGALGTESEDTKRRVHPTQKPIRLLQPMMEEYIKPDMLVADPFLGSGATLIACENLGYRCVGVEIEPQYADVIIARFEAHTGKTATLLQRASEVSHA